MDNMNKKKRKLESAPHALSLTTPALPSRIEYYFPKDPNGGMVDVRTTSSSLTVIHTALLA
jgi:hypothetical protein